MQKESVLAEGPGGMLWAALLRAEGFRGAVTVLPYLNPRQWRDVAMLSFYRRFAGERDRVFVGSTPSANVYRRLGVAAQVGEPFGVDQGVFRKKPNPHATAHAFRIPDGRKLLYAGRIQPDKDLYSLLRVAFRAQILFPDLRAIIASDAVDEDYLNLLRDMTSTLAVHWILNPTRDQLADLYNLADVFVTAATSCFETFGRAPAEALACGTRTIAPRYDGFVEVLAQPGGTLVDVVVGEDGPRVDEERLLRSIYDVLSSTRPPSSDEISAAALRRFGRSHTIRLLAHLTSTAPSEVQPAALPARSFALPPAWLDALSEMDRLPQSEVTSWMWTHEAHARLCDHDAEFVKSVRLNLCDPANFSN
ncbi:glycosyltransferase family 4 protein [Roseiarcus sp.]|uniref:glycosyltransferase family 4 protein n=1 Tax=Roseiarcus sp. TaxID=1969460 RepID=UPI003F97BDA5